MGETDPLTIYQELLDELELLMRCHREEVNAEERIFWPLEYARQAAKTKVENLRGEN